jgi:hypothetical protein
MFMLFIVKIHTHTHTHIYTIYITRFTNLQLIGINVK